MALLLPYLTNVGSKVIEGEDLETAAKESIPDVANIFGPGYDPKNGGEVDRQLRAMPEWASDPSLMDAYKLSLQKYWPGLWQSGDIWDVQRALSAGHPSAYRDAYLQAVQAGAVRGEFALTPDGALLKNEGEGVDGGKGGTKSGGGNDGDIAIKIPTWLKLLGVLALLVWLVGKISGSPRGNKAIRKTAKRGARSVRNVTRKKRKL